MFKSYLIIATRRLLRERLYVLVNVFSLALGLTSFFVVGLFIRAELTYDKHNTAGDRIYRLTSTYERSDGQVSRFATTAIGIGPMLTKDYPQIGKQVRFRPSTQKFLKGQERIREWDQVYLADPAIFDLFPPEVVFGDARTALERPNSIAISESVANYYFGSENPIGKSLSSGPFVYAVTLVFKDLPANTHLRYDAVFPMSMMDVFFPGFSNNYANNLYAPSAFTYILLSENGSLDTARALTNDFISRRLANEMKARKSKVTIQLQPLEETHFGQGLTSDLPVTNPLYTFGFSIVALFTLIVACVNYVNLATARAQKRAKEVGMRKVLGASRTQLIAQFMGESFAFVLLAVLIALALGYMSLTLTPLGSLLGNDRLLEASTTVGVWAGVGLVVLSVGFLSGIYPAIYLSSFSPLNAFSMGRQQAKSRVSVKYVLAGIQLMVATGVVACTILMFDQMRYVDQKPLGFDKENRTLVTLRGYEVVLRIPAIVAELRKLSGVADVAVVQDIPGANFGSISIPIERESGDMEVTTSHILGVGKNFAKAMNIKVAQGRAFSEDLATDGRATVMVNESFVKSLGWSDPIGKKVQFGSNVSRVIGVARDFHYDSLHNAIAPLIIDPISDDPGFVPENQKAFTTRTLVVVLSPNWKLSNSDVMNGISRTIGQFDPQFRFESTDLKDRLAVHYKAEFRLMKLGLVLAFICIAISVMGLIGLVAFVTEQRTREIAIRKVLGASSLQIVSMFTSRFSLLAAVAAIPGCIVSYFAISKWLGQFAYKTDIDISSLVLSAFLVLAISIVTVASLSLRAASTEPSESLRYE